MRPGFFTYIYVLFLLFFCSISSAAQNTVKDMRRRAGALQKQIVEKEQILLSSQKDVKSRMQNIDLLSAQIKERKELISVLQHEIELLDDSIAKLDGEIHENEKGVGVAKEEYAKALSRTIRYGTLQDRLLFIISASDFNTMVRRYRYTREYMEAHRALASSMKSLIAELEKRRSRLDTTRIDKAEALRMHDEQKRTLHRLEEEQRTLVAGLKKDAGKVRAELEKQRKQLNKLNADIERIIERELARQRERERAEAAAQAKREKEQRAAKGKGGAASSSASSGTRKNRGVTAMDGKFVRNKGKLPAPITGSYQLVSGYGARKGVLGKGNVLIDNGGIVLQGTKGAKARCIFEGQVTAVFRSADYAFVIVRHDNYLSVYCQLDKIHVKEGDKVKAGTIVGDIAEDASGQTRLLFQLHEEKRRLNPLHWLML